MKVNLRNEVYDVLKWVVTILIPAISVFYGALAVVWHFPAGVEVTTSLGALAVFLGALMNRSTKSYNEKADGPELGEGL